MITKHAFEIFHFLFLKHTIPSTIHCIAIIYTIHKIWELNSESFPSNDIFHNSYVVRYEDPLNTLKCRARPSMTWKAFDCNGLHTVLFSKSRT